MDSSQIAVIIASYGAVIATSVGIWNIYAVVRDRPHIRVKVAWALPVHGPTVGDWQIVIEAANTGRRPVTLVSAGMTLPDNIDLVLTDPRARLPCELCEGQSCSVFFDLTEVQMVLQQRGYVNAPKHGWFRDATGRLHKTDVPKGIAQRILRPREYEGQDE